MGGLRVRSQNATNVTARSCVPLARFGGIFGAWYRGRTVTSVTVGKYSGGECALSPSPINRIELGEGAELAPPGFRS